MNYEAQLAENGRGWIAHRLNGEALFFESLLPNTSETALIVDMHVHLGEKWWLKERKAQADKVQEFGPQEAIERMKRAGVDKAVVFSIPEGGSRGCLDNDSVMSAAKKYPDRFVPFVVVDPTWRDARDEIERCLKLGAKGIKLHPQLHGYSLSNHDLVDPIFEMAAKNRMVVISHGLGDNIYTVPIRFAEMAETFADVSLVMAHSGFMFGVDEARRYIKKYENLYGDTTCLYTYDLRNAVEYCGANKFLMGTDEPWGAMEEQIWRVKFALPKEEDRRLVLGANAARLLNLE